jgi:hypothetical protein
VKPPAGEKAREAAGLCAECRHAQVIRSERGPVYYLCRKSFEDARYAKYPRLPVRACPGYEKSSD